MTGLPHRRTSCLGLGLGLMGLAWASVAHSAGPPQRADSLGTPPDQLKSTTSAPVTFDFDGQARIRYEYDDSFTLKGYAPGDQDPLLLERVRLDLGVRWREGPRAFLQLQDAHAFLTRLKDRDFPTSNSIEDALDVRQLYLEWLHVADGPLGLRLGRQQISYGDQRVFGPGNWGNTGRFAWDAAMLKFESDRLSSDLWAGDYLRYKSDVWPDRGTPDFLTLVDYTQVRRLPFRLDLFYVLKRDVSGRVAGESGAGDLLSHTAGFQAEGRALRRLDSGATLVGQFGRHGEDRLRAFGANAKLGATLPTAWAPHLGAQYTWGSGDRNPSDGVHGTFDGVFGGRDIFFYGYLNLFFWANLHDAEIDFRVRPRRALTMHLEYHRFRLDRAADAWYSTGLKEQRRDPAGQSGTSLGDELDVRATMTLSDDLELMAGYGRFFPGDFVRATGPAAKASWSFAQAVFSW